MNLSLYGLYLYQLKIWEVINCYFVKEDDGLTLIDTGMAGNANLIMEAVAKINSPICRITLTHAHADHAGSLDKLSLAYPDAEIFLGERTARFLSGDLTLLPSEPQAKIKGSFVQAKTQLNVLVHPGSKIGSLEVIAAPGHSPDQIAFYDPREKTLIAGDAFQTQGGFAISGAIRWAFPFPALATWHKPTALDTAKNLLMLAPEQLAVGHGPILHQPVVHMEKAIDQLKNKGK